MKKYLPQSTGVLWWGVALFFLLAIFFLLPVQPNDYWWYLRLGGDILRTGHIPAADSYSFTRAETPMVYHSWLSAVAFWALYRWGGPDLTVLARAVLLAATFTLVWGMAWRAGAGSRWGAVVAFGAAMLGSNNWAMRPQLFAYPLFALMLWELWRWLRGEHPRPWLFFGLMALWVNLHGSFVLGFLLVGAALVGGDGARRPLAISLGMMTLASLLNPRGWGAWQYVWTLLRNPASRQLGAEWQPPTPETWQGALFFVVLILLIALIGWQMRRQEVRLSGAEWLWLAGFGLMGLSAVRYGIWFALVAAPVAARLLAPGIPPRFRVETRGIPALNGAFLALFIILPLTLLPNVRAGWWADAPPALSSDTPVAATQWLADHPELPGELWSDLTFSSYLIFALPERPVWIDTRFELYPLSQWEDYRAIAAARSGWESRLDAAGVSLLMLNPAATPDLIAAAAQSPRWQEVYRDDTAIIFEKILTPPNN